MEENIIYTLKIDEYTNEIDVLTIYPKLIPIYFVLKSCNNYPILNIINDLRRIIEYYKIKPFECKEFIKDKYPCEPAHQMYYYFHGKHQEWKNKYLKWDNDTIFIECLNSLISNNIIDNNSEFVLLIKLSNIELNKDFSIDAKLKEAYKHFEPKDSKQDTSTIENDSKKPKPDTEQHKQLPRFTRLFSETEQKNLFDGLTKGGFLPKETDYIYFCYVFGGKYIQNNKKTFNPIVWQKSVGLLAYLIENLFSDTDKTNIWKITANVFIWKGNPPKKDTMKNTVSKYNDKTGYNNKPRGYDQIDVIITNL